MGAYTVILRHTPDHEDLITVTDSEVLCRLVDRWVGQGAKASLVNTSDVDILEYILTKVTTRITAKARTFLVKVPPPLPKGRRSSARSKRLVGGTESQVKHWPKDVISVKIQMERTDNDSQRRNGSRLTGTRDEAI